jgi:hypothetical protein
MAKLRKKDFLFATFNAGDYVALYCDEKSGIFYSVQHRTYLARAFDSAIYNERIAISLEAMGYTIKIVPNPMTVHTYENVYIRPGFVTGNVYVVKGLNVSALSMNRRSLERYLPRVSDRVWEAHAKFGITKNQLAMEITTYLNVVLDLTTDFASAPSLMDIKDPTLPQEEGWEILV